MSPRKSEGCFVVRNNGRLEYRFVYRDEYGQKKRKSISGGSREECCRRADEWLQKYMESFKPLDQRSTITDILQRKYEGDYKANHIGESTLRSKRELLRIIYKYIVTAIRFYSEPFQAHPYAACSVQAFHKAFLFSVSS